MWRSLQRFFREKEIDFDRYDVTTAELKEFCGMAPNVSVYVGSRDEVRGSRTPTPPGSVKATDFEEEELMGEGEKNSASVDHVSVHPVGGKRPKDLIERLMEKGLVLLAAMDILQGWQVFETASETDMRRPW